MASVSIETMALALGNALAVIGDGIGCTSISVIAVKTDSACEWFVDGFAFGEGGERVMEAGEFVTTRGGMVAHE